MKKYISLSIGLVTIVCGLVFVLSAFEVLWRAVQGVLGIALILAGYLFLMSGIVRKH